MKKRIVKFISLLFLSSLLVVSIIIYRLYNKPHRSAETVNALLIAADKLVMEYETNEPEANKKYLGNPVQVTGVIADIASNQQGKPVIVLQGSDMAAVQCTLEKNTGNLKKGDWICIKGFCTGFLTDVIMDRCIIPAKKNS